ncbi:glycosyltransferase involved in cell wall biosynthesis [Novosphingobium chloroacetimidivorans]|uniref:Glycosyltransferase involved in cell wall biosynthesis n=1 Tax=Novosphingobium chloroacetimidivorans TaxID=1428314 RepID=A0A7W7NUC7_9SPHN|nr:glycosyltransferase involved in cell wall biosynthesis [Novosphingobium chloroacetimidivorans]
MAETQVLAGHQVHACSLVRDPQPRGERHGVATRPLGARNPLWIESSHRYPSPLRLANKAVTVLNRRVGSEFAALLDDIEPDVLHTHSMVELPPSVWDRAARRGVPIVHTLHDYDLLCIRGALYKDGRRCRPRHAACRLLSAPKRALHDRIDVVAAVSRTVLDTHLEHGLFHHLPPERRRVVWNPARLAQAGPRTPRKAGEPLRFGFLGRLVGEKGLGPILDACRLVGGSGWTLRVAGDGPERAAFEHQSRGLPIRFEGYVEAAAFLSEIDVLICAPLWDEPFGLTMVEGYAAGCRVIGTRAGVIGEVVERVEPGWTVAPGDVAAMAAAIARAIAEGRALPADRQGAVAALLEELAPRTVAQTYLELYRTAGDAATPSLAAHG